MSEIVSGASNGASSLETQMDTVAEESESTPTVTVTWEKDQERSDIKKKTSGGEQMIVKETADKDVSKS